MEYESVQCIFLSGLLIEYFFGPWFFRQELRIVLKITIAKYPDEFSNNPLPNFFSWWKKKCLPDKMLSNHKNQTMKEIITRTFVDMTPSTSTPGCFQSAVHRITEVAKLCLEIKSKLIKQESLFLRRERILTCYLWLWRIFHALLTSQKISISISGWNWIKRAENYPSKNGILFWVILYPRLLCFYTSLFLWIRMKPFLRRFSEENFLQLTPTPKTILPTSLV